MPENEQFKAQISADVSRFIKAVDTAISALTKFDAESTAAGAAVDKLEKDLVGLAEAGKALQKSMESSTAAVAKQTVAMRAQAAAAQDIQKAIATLSTRKMSNGVGNFDFGLINSHAAEKAKEIAAAEKAADSSAAKLAATVDAGNRKMEAGYNRVTQSVNRYNRGLRDASIGAGAAKDWDRAFAAVSVDAERAARSVAVLNANAGDNTLLRSMQGSAEYTKILDDSVSGLANQRYALYDVAASLGVVSVALGALPAGAAAAGASFEQAFASVARTTGETGDELADLKNSLEGISSEMPVAFGDVTQIATLAAQLGIANDNIAAFSKTVAQFSATTNVTIDAAATGFGRLAQLTKTPQDQISNLANSIYQVGINSVATESDVLSMAQELATSGNLAGFTQQQIIGLAGALASLGVAPEQARSAIMRIFGQITTAVGKGGDALDAFAQTSGMTAKQFAAQWQKDPQVAFNAYLNGLHKIQEETKNANGALQDQGFSNVRDRNVLTRLAQNMDVYNQTLNDSAEAYKNNTALADGYAIATDTLQAKLSVLANNFKEFLAAISENAPLKAVVGWLNEMFKAAKELASNPLASWVAKITLGLLTIGSVLAASLAGFILYKASLLAVSTALSNAARNSAATTLSIRALNKELLASVLAGTRFGAALNTAAAGESAAAIANVERSATGAATGLNSASTAAKGFGISMRGALITTGIGAALVALPVLINAVGNAFKSNGEKAKDYFGDVSGLSEAISKDTAAAEKGAATYGTLDVKVSSASDSLAGWAQDLSTASGAQVALGKATSDTTTEVTTQTAALGASTKAWLAQALVNNSKFQESWKKNSDVLKDAGFDLQEFFNQSLKNPGSGAENYIDKIGNSLQKLRAQMLQASGGNWTPQIGGLDQQLDALHNIREAAVAVDGEFDNFKSKQELVNAVSAAAGVQLDTQGQVIDELGESANDTSGDLSDMSDKLSDMANAAMGNVNSLVSVNDALYSLGQGLQNNGLDFSAVTDAGRENLGNLQSAVSAMAQAANGDANVFANSIISMIEGLQEQGVDTSNQLGFLFNLLNQLVGKTYNINFSTQAARTNLASFLTDAANGLNTLQASYNALFEQLTGFNQSAVNSVGVLSPQMSQIYDMAKNNTVQLGNQVAALNQAAQVAGTNKDIFKQTGDAGKQIAQGFGDAAKKANDAANGAKKLKDNTKDAAKEVRTLVDYGNDLSSVFNRDFEIRFGDQQASDSTADQFQQMLDDRQKLKDAVADDKKNIKDLKQQWNDAAADVKKYQQQINGLKSSNKVLEYQLKVARQYGDTVRANAIQAQIADNNADIAEASKNKNDAQADEKDITKQLTAANKQLTEDQKALTEDLKGNTAQARANRQAMEDLTQSYLDQLAQMAKNGASQKEINDKAKEFSTRLQEQGQKLGYTKDQLTPYTDALKDVPDIVAKVPRDITTKVNAKTDPAQTAINEFINKNKNKSVTATVNAKTPSATTSYNAGKTAGGKYTGGFNTRKTPAAKLPNDGAAPGKTHGHAYGEAWVVQVNAKRKITAVKDKSVPGGIKYHTAGSNVYFFNKGGQVPQYLASGGVGGSHPGKPRGSDTVPAWLTPGEFVLRKSAVNALGLPYLNALNRMQRPIYRASGGGTGTSTATSGGIAVVEILPSQVRALARAVSTQLVLDGKVVAESTNSQNRNNSVRGAS